MYYISPKFDPEKHVLVRRGIAPREREMNGIKPWGGSCSTCHKDGIDNQTGLPKTGMHWSESGIIPEDGPARLYIGYTNKNNVLNREEVERNYGTHHITHIAGEPIPDVNAEWELPLREGSIVHLTKTIHYIPGNVEGQRNAVTLVHPTKPIIIRSNRVGGDPPPSPDLTEYLKSRNL